MFNSSMSEEDFFKWLKSKGIGEKDCKTLSGNDNNLCCCNESFDYCYMYSLIVLENGITPSGFTQLDAEDFNDIGLTKFGKKIVLKTLAEVIAVS